MNTEYTGPLYNCWQNGAWPRETMLSLGLFIDSLALEFLNKRQKDTASELFVSATNISNGIIPQYPLSPPPQSSQCCCITAAAWAVDGCEAGELELQDAWQQPVQGSEWWPGPWPGPWAVSSLR